MSRPPHAPDPAAPTRRRDATVPPDDWGAVAEELLERARAGLPPGPEWARLPEEWRARLQRLLEADRAVLGAPDGARAVPPTQWPGPAPAAPAPERLGPYRLLGELGRGGMGVVYRAHHEALARDFALKVIPPADLADPEVAERFRREARAAARLGDHPGIVGVHDFGETDGRLWFAMDLVDGPCLDDVIGEGVGAHAHMADLIEQVARALHYAHANGVLHRDLKPSNILIDRGDGRARITDFGLAMPLRPDPAMQRLTRTKMLMGTPAYMSPEQARGLTLDVRSDVWALGATLYDCLTGRSPFQHDEQLELMRRITDADPVPPRRLDPSVPPALETIALKCLEKDPDRRYPTAEAVAADLARFRAGEPVAARRVGPLGRWERRVRRNPAPWALGAAAALALAALPAVWALQAWHARGRHQAAIDALVASGRRHAAAHERARAALAEVRTGYAEWRRGTRAADSVPDEWVARLDAAAHDVEAAHAAAQAGFLGARELQGTTADPADRRAVLHALAALAFGRLQDAEAAGRTADAARFAADLAGAHQSLLALGDAHWAPRVAGDGTLTLDALPSGAEVQLLAQVDAAGDGRLRDVDRGVVGRTPLARVPVPMGAYVCVLRAPGMAEARYPVAVGRNADVVVRAPVALLPPEAIGEGYVWIPAGESILGDDDGVTNARPREVRWVDGFCLARREVTWGEYRRFVSWLVLHEGLEAANARCPRRSSDNLPYFTIDGDVIRFPRAFTDDLPVFGVTFHDAAAYCEWRSREEGRRVRLPTAVEWERAARGADGRRYPWGQGFAWAWVDGGGHARGLPQPAGSVEADASPFGVRSLAGGVWEWCADGPAAHADNRAVCGGAWSISDADVFASARRTFASVIERRDYLGFRVAADPKR